MSSGWWVQCDAALNDEAGEAGRPIRLLVGFHMRQAAYPVMYSVALRPDGTTATRTVLQGADTTL